MTMRASTDRTKRIKVTVKAEHIKEGRAQSCDACPIALAMREQHDPNALIGVCVATIHNVNYYAPKAARKFIDVFDLAHEHGTKPRVKPFTFYLQKRQ